MADPARTAALEVLRAVRSADAYTNLALPAALRRHGLTGRDAAFATELASGTVRRQGLYDAVLAACVDRPLAKVQARVLDALRLGTHQLLAMRVPRARRDLHDGRAGALRRRAGRGRVRQRRAAPGRASTTSTAGSTGSPRTPATTGSGTWPSRTRTRAGWSRSSHAAVGDATRSRRCWPPTTSLPGVTLVARPGRSTRDELPGRADPLVAVRRAPGLRRPGRGRRRRRGPGGRPGRGLAAGRPCAGGRAARRAGPALARPVRRPGRQGRAARGAGGRARRGVLANELSRTGPASCAARSPAPPA